MKTEQPMLFQIHDFSDVEQKRGSLTNDDKAFDREQKRKSREKSRKHFPLTRAPKTGPACLRCRSWAQPIPGDHYGECQHLVVAADAVQWANVKRGDVIDRETARDTLYIQYDYLRTGEAFQCSAYAAFGERAA